MSNVRPGIKGRKIMIVFEETGGPGFNVYLSGFPQPKQACPDDQLTPAEFWSAKMFQIVASYLKNSGCVDKERDMGPPAGSLQ